MICTTFLCILGALFWSGANGDDSIKKISLRTHSIRPPYLDADMQSRWFDYGGDTIIRSDRYIRLSSDRASRTGWLFSKIPLTATNWEVEFEFKIHGAQNLHGDGMALWVTKQRGEQGPVFGSTDKFEGLGLFFDTYKNNRPGTVFPYVMAMLGDGKTAYDKDTDGTDQELAGCSARGLRGASIPTKARLTYFQEQSLKLELQYQSETEWTTCFETGPVTLPSVAYLGFSAETGELSDNFDIISVETKNLYTTEQRVGGAGDHKKLNRPPSKGKGKGATKGSSSRGGSGWGWTFVKLVLFIVACGLGYIGWTTYKTQRRGSRFD